MKAAMMGFLEQHGSRPEAAAILPEIIKNASMMNPSERNEITEFANRSFSSLSGFSQSPVFKQSPLGQRFGPNMLPVSGNRPVFSSALKPKQTPSAPGSGAGERFVSQDHMTAMRDEVFRVNETIRQSGQIPAQNSSDMQKSVRPASAQQSQASPHHISRESFEPVLGAQKSHAIMSSLISRISSHGRSESFRTASRPVMAAAKRRKSPVSRSARAKRRVKTKARTARPKTRTKTRTKTRSAAKTRKSRPSKTRKQPRRAFKRYKSG
jgi:hypothetical protein